MSRVRIDKIVSRAVLLILLIWGCVSFFLFTTLPLIEWTVAALGVIAFILVFVGLGELFLLLFINFTNLYAFYGLLFTYNLHPAIVMIGLAIVSGSSFFLLGRKMVEQKNNFYSILIFFLLSVLELYLALSFWLVNPLSRSLIVMIFIYLFVGFLTSIKGEIFSRKNFRVYLLTAIVIFSILIFTISWGR